MEKDPDAFRRLACHCFGKTSDEIRAAAAREGWTTAGEVSLHLLAGAGCATCRPEIEAILADLAAERRKARKPGDARDPSLKTSP